MKYFSEITNKPYDSVEELELEESKALAEDAKTSAEPTIQESNEDQHLERPSRKQLACEVEAADEALKEANANLEVANKTVEEMYQQFLKEANEIIAPAKKAVRDAHHARYAAIEKFNQEYGAYQVTYTGARAADEVLRALKEIDARTSNMFRNWFWF